MRIFGAPEVAERVESEVFQVRFQARVVHVEAPEADVFARLHDGFGPTEERDVEVLAVCMWLVCRAVSLALSVLCLCVAG